MVAEGRLEEESNTVSINLQMHMMWFWFVGYLSIFHQPCLFQGKIYHGNHFP